MSCLTEMAGGVGVGGLWSGDGACSACGGGEAAMARRLQRCGHGLQGCDGGGGLGRRRRTRRGAQGAGGWRVGGDGGHGAQATAAVRTRRRPRGAATVEGAAGVIGGETGGENIGDWRKDNGSGGRGTLIPDSGEPQATAKMAMAVARPTTGTGGDDGCDWAMEGARGRDDEAVDRRSARSSAGVTSAAAGGDGIPNDVVGTRNRTCR